MENISLEEIKLIGLGLGKKTTNQNGQSAIDCGNHWQKFISGGYAEKVSNKISDEVYAVYHDYEGDHTKPYSYFIGCPVDDNSTVPDGMNSLTIAKAIYIKITAKGKMPDCVANTWMDIWKTNIDRAYIADFEMYGEGCKDWERAEVDVYVGVKEFS